ncbi:hypothetical protein Tco_1206536 [Tanacetum coccineum]
MASQDARLSKFEADFKQQQGEMTNKNDTVLKAITDRITRALPSDTVKNPKLNVNSTSPVLSVQKVSKLNSFLESSGLVPRLSNTKFVCTKEDDGDVMFIKIIKKYDDSHEEELKVEEVTNRIACRNFFQENECEIFTEAGDDVMSLACENSKFLVNEERSLEVLKEFQDDDTWMTI